MKVSGYADLCEVLEIWQRRLGSTVHHIISVLSKSLGRVLY